MNLCDGILPDFKTAYNKQTNKQTKLKPHTLFPCLHGVAQSRGFGVFKMQLLPKPAAMAEEGGAAEGVMDGNTAPREGPKTVLIHDGLA